MDMGWYDWGQRQRNEGSWWLAEPADSWQAGGIYDKQAGGSVAVLIGCISCILLALL